MAVNEVPEWVKIVYRGLRASVGAMVGQLILLKPDWNNPEEALRTLGVAFVAGFLPAFGMWLRDVLDEKFGFKPSGLVQRVMPI